MNEEEILNKLDLKKLPTGKKLKELVNDTLDNPKLLFDLGNVFYLKKDFNSAVTVFKELSNNKTHRLQIYLKLAYSLTITGDLTEALQYYDKALKIDSKNIMALGNKGIILGKMKGREEESIKFFKQILEFKPKDIDTLENIGRALLKLDKEEEAIPYFEKVLEINKNSSSTLAILGDALFKLGKNDEAISCYKKALEISPNDTIILTNIGSSLSNNGQEKQAIPYFEKALKINSDNPLALKNLGITLSKMGKKEKALQCFQKILQFDQNDITALVHLGLIYAKQNKSDAIVYFEKALKIEPKDLYIIGNLCRIYRKKNFEIKEINLLKKAIKYYPNNASLLIDLGASLSNIGKEKEAIPYLEKGLKIDPEEEAGLTGIGITLGKLGKEKEAIPYLEKAIKLYPQKDFAKEMLKHFRTHLLTKKVSEYIEKEQYQQGLNYLGKQNILEFEANSLNSLINVLNIAKSYSAKSLKKAYKEVTVRTLEEFVTVVSKWKEQQKGDYYIYRGQENQYYPLLPSLLRTKKIAKDIKQRERNLWNDFNIKSNAFFNDEMDHFDDIDKLVSMQHHGISTRLLDFSESPLVALYFAVESTTDENFWGKSPCIWMVDISAFSYNREGILCSDAIKSEKASNEIFNITDENFVFSAKLKNKRLTIQKGVFVMFNNEKPLEEYIQRKTKLLKMVIPYNCVNKIQNSLRTMGLTPTRIFPDFEGLAKELKNPRNFSLYSPSPKIKIDPDAKYNKISYDKTKDI